MSRHRPSLVLELPPARMAYCLACSQPWPCHYFTTTHTTRGDQMDKDTMYREAKRLLVDMPPCVDGNYQFACNSCVAQAIATWAERIYQQGREDQAQFIVGGVQA